MWVIRESNMGKMGWCGVGVVESIGQLTSQNIHVNMLELYLCNN